MGNREDFSSFEEDDDEDEQGHSPVLIVFIVLFVVALIFTAYWFIKPGFTGYVAAPFDYIKLNTTITGDSSFTFGSENDEPFLLNSMKVAGRVIGNGSVDVILNDGEKEYVVYSSKLKEKPMAGVTGFAVYDTNSGITIDWSNVNVYGENENVVSGLTIVNLDDNKDVSIERIKFTLTPSNNQKIESMNLMGDEIIQASKGTAYVGQIIDTKDITISKGAEAPIDEITFETSVKNVVMDIEVYYRPYKALFILGDEQAKKITVDLTGKTIASTNISELRKVKESSILGIDTSGTKIEGDTLKNIVLINNHRSQKLTIDKIAVIWDPYNNEKIVEVIDYKKEFFKTENGINIGEYIDGNDVLIELKETSYIDAIRFDKPIEAKNFKISFYFTDGSSKAFDFNVGKNSKEIPDLNSVFGKYQGQVSGETKPTTGQEPAVDNAALAEAKKEIEGVNLIGMVIPSTATSSPSELPALTFAYDGGAIPFTPKTQEQLKWVDEIRNNPEAKIMQVQSECVDTCSFSVALQKSKYIIKFVVTPGTVFELEGIYFEGRKIA